MARFDFPTPIDSVIDLYQLSANLVDLADGDDDVSEKRQLDEGFVRECFLAGRPPSVLELARVAAGGVAPTEACGAHPTPAPHEDPAGWQDLADALEGVEELGELDGAAAARALATLGFARAPQHESSAGALVFERGATQVGLRLLQLGAIRAAEIAVAGDQGGASATGENTFGALQPGSSGAYVAGALVEPRFWRVIVEELNETLELAEEALDDAGKKGRVPELPLAFETLKRFIKTGESKRKRKEAASERAILQDMQDRITGLWRQMRDEGSAPASVVVALDGTDGAGKSSSARYILDALLAGGSAQTLRVEIFKAPTDQDKAWYGDDAAAHLGLAPSQARHVMRGTPAQGEVLFKDRFQPGDYTYAGDDSVERRQELAGEYAAYLAWLQPRSVLHFATILHADRDKASKTFGKRMARGAFVDALRVELQLRDALTTKVDADLQAVKDKVEGTDLRSLESFQDTLKRFQDFGQAAGIPVVNSTRRHEARLGLMHRFLVRLQEWRRDARG